MKIVSGGSIVVKRAIWLYVGEFVLANDVIYLIQPDGEVFEMGGRHELFEES